MSDARLQLEQLTLRLGAFHLGALDLAVAPGEILVLLGPNGAGKSVTLEAIAGFHRIDSGRILLGARDISDEPPERRRISLMFQNFALFPHLTAAGNVALALRAASMPADSRSTLRLLERFGVAGIADRLPELLSPGEKQRVALARALARTPALFLFDEPFSALDGPTRNQLRETLKDFLRQSAAPTVFVTHDHTEALALGDALALLRDGALEQSGAAELVYRAPATAFAARFLGVENILAARVVGRDQDFWHLAIGDTLLRAAIDPARRPSTEVSIALRAEDVVLSPEQPRTNGVNRLTAAVVALGNGGALVKATLDAGFRLVATLAKREAQRFALAPGQRIAVEIEPAAIHLLA